MNIQSSGAKKRLGAAVIWLVLVPGAIGCAAYGIRTGGLNLRALLPGQGATQQEVNAVATRSGNTTPERIVAIVNGTNVTEAEVTGAGISSAVSHAQLLDDYVNKTLMAQQAQNHSTPELAARLERARRELLASAWVQDTSQKIQSSLTLQEMKAVYDTEIKDSMFAHYKLSFVRAATAAEAEGEHKDWTALKTDKGDEWLLPEVIPYQMGGLVATLKKGESTQAALAVRDGFLRIRVDDIKEGKKPGFEDLKPRIADVLVGRKLQIALQELRGRADIRIK